MDAQALAETQQDHTRISASKLLKKIQENRARHVAEYKEALAGWVGTYSQALEVSAESMKAHAQAMSNGSIDIAFNWSSTQAHPPRPVSHEGDYDLIITRLEMSLDPEIWISNRQFEQYVLDRWSWKGEHEIAMTRYLSK